MRYIMTLDHTVDHTAELSPVGHYVSLDSWLASLTITFLI